MLRGRQADGYDERWLVALCLAGIVPLFYVIGAFGAEITLAQAPARFLGGVGFVLFVMFVATVIARRTGRGDLFGFGRLFLLASPPACGEAETAKD